MTDSKINRRDFVKTSALALLASTLAPGLLRNVEAKKDNQSKPEKNKEEPLPAGMTAVSETDPVASAIGYKPDASQIDFKKYPKRKLKDAQNQHCENCALYSSVNGSWGKCQLLTSGLVAHKGWCGSWSKKA